MVKTICASDAATKDAKRRRPATTCTTCRERRVKCGREKPICTACKRGKRRCVYDKVAPPGIDFVLEPVCASSPTVQSVDSWSDVINRQAKLLQNLDDRNSVAQDREFWTLNGQAESDNALNKASTFTYFSSKGSPLSSLGSHFVNDFVRQLPTQVECNAILDNYLNNVHPLLPICYIPSLRDIISILHSSSVGELALENVILACAVLYVGASTAMNKSQCDYKSSLFATYENLAHHVKFIEYFTTFPSLQLLQGHMLYNMIRGGQLPPFAAFGFLPETIRCAQLLGLHIERQCPHDEQEVRRRTWWHLVFLDVEASITSGLQSIIRPNGYNTAQPSSSPTVPLPGSANTSSALLIALQGQSLLARAIQTWFEQRPSHDEILKFETSIMSLSRQIEHATGNQAEWARLYLQLQVNRAYCMSGLRFWQLDDFRNTSCQGEVVNTARLFLQTYLQLLELSETIGFSWFIPGFLQPIHALMILLKHLSACRYPQLESIESRELVERVVTARRNWLKKGTVRPRPVWARTGSASLFGSQDLNHSQMGRSPRYALLWSLKNEVWKKFGWLVEDNLLNEKLWEHRDPAQSQHVYAMESEYDASINEVENGTNYVSGVDPNSMNIFGQSLDTSANMSGFGQFDWFFDIDELLAQKPLSPLEWDQWPSDPTGQDNLS